LPAPLVAHPRERIIITRSSRSLLIRYRGLSTRSKSLCVRALVATITTTIHDYILPFFILLPLSFIASLCPYPLRVTITSHGHVLPCFLVSLAPHLHVSLSVLHDHDHGSSPNTTRLLSLIPTPLSFPSPCLRVSVPTCCDTPTCVYLNTGAIFRINFNRHLSLNYCGLPTPPPVG
jgi:hypothetical protein